MTTIEKSIEVNVPVRTAYNQWTQFEDFPRFMEGVQEVRQLDDKRLHWRAETLKSSSKCRMNGLLGEVQPAPAIPE
jgi:uncharacterized membrane protein